MSKEKSCLIPNLIFLKQSINQHGLYNKKAFRPRALANSLLSGNKRVLNVTQKGADTPHLVYYPKQTEGYNTIP